jgi:hypothetical protein
VTGAAASRVLRDPKEKQQRRVSAVTIREGMNRHMSVYLYLCRCTSLCFNINTTRLQTHSIARRRLTFERADAYDPQVSSFEMQIPYSLAHGPLQE